MIVIDYLRSIYKLKDSLISFKVPIINTFRKVRYKFHYHYYYYCYSIKHFTFLKIKALPKILH